jgi:hypothetical protein
MAVRVAFVRQPMVKDLFGCWQAWLAAEDSCYLCFVWAAIHFAAVCLSVITPPPPKSLNTSALLFERYRTD